MAARTLAVELVGAGATGGDVLLADFRDYCASLATCLRVIEERISIEHRLDYRIVGLERGCAIMRLQPVTTDSDAQAGTKVLELFSKTVRALEKGGQLDRRISGIDLFTFKKLAEPLNKRIASIRINRIAITSRYLDNIDCLLESTIHSEGSARGFIERLNLHNRNEFTLYPTLGNPISCSFLPDVFQQVKDAIKKNVTVYGKLSYFPGSTYPDKAQVTRIEIHAADDELPRLSDLKGSLRGQFGGKTATEYLQAIRDAKSA